MSAKNQSKPTKLPRKAINNGVAVELNKEEIANLAGYFDVLIQMDLQKKITNELKDKYEGKNFEQKN